MVLAGQNEQAESKHDKNGNGIQQEQDADNPRNQQFPGGFICVHMEGQPAQGENGVGCYGVKRPVVTVKDPNGTNIEDGKKGGKKKPCCGFFISGHRYHAPAISLWSIMRTSSAQATRIKINSSSRCSVQIYRTYCRSKRRIGEITSWMMTRTSRKIMET